MDIRQKARIPTIQLIDHMKLKKKKVQSMNASVLLRRENKVIMEGRGREGPERERRRGGKAWEGSGVGADRVVGEVQRVRNLNKGVP